MQFENTAMGVTLTLNAVTQGMLELFVAGMQALPENVTAEAYNGAVVREAIKAGWVSVPAVSVEAVSGMEPRAVKWLALKIVQHRRELTTVPKD